MDPDFFGEHIVFLYILYGWNVEIYDSFSAGENKKKSLKNWKCKDETLPLTLVVQKKDY